MKLIGLTGGIGAGKSVVARILRLRGFDVYDCDLRARALMENSERIRRGLLERFGKECFLEDGRPDRAHIAGRVFSDDADRAFVNMLVHSEVREDIRLLAEKWAGRGAEKIFIESAIMHTSGLDLMADEIWVVEAPEEVRLGRAMVRDNASRESVAARMKAQNDELAGLPGCKVRKIDNSGLASLIAAVDSLLEVPEF